MQRFRRAEMYWLALHARRSLIEWRQNRDREDLRRSWVSFDLRHRKGLGFSYNEKLWISNVCFFQKPLINKN